MWQWARSSHLSRKLKSGWHCLDSSWAIQQLHLASQAKWFQQAYHKIQLGHCECLYNALLYSICAWKLGCSGAQYMWWKGKCSLSGWKKLNVEVKNPGLPLQWKHVYTAGMLIGQKTPDRIRQAWGNNLIIATSVPFSLINSTLHCIWRTGCSIWFLA